MILVRHGETVSNLEQRCHGRRDSPLTERGIAQAQAIAHKLNTLLDLSSVEIISSPQPRAHRTAEIIRECFDSTLSPVRLDDRLCEVSIGGWEGLSQAEIIGLASGTFEGDGRHNWCFRAPNGETYAEFEARLTRWLLEISDHPALIVVTHGIVVRVLRGLYAGLERSLALCLPIPQDRVFRLAGGKIEEIAVQVSLTMPRIAQSLHSSDAAYMSSLMMSDRDCRCSFSIARARRERVRAGYHQRFSCGLLAYGPRLGIGRDL